MLQQSLDLLLQEAVEKKEKIIEDLIQIIGSSKEERTISKIGFVLVDHFKDVKIEEVLTQLIADPAWQNRNGTFLYLLSEYSTDSKYLYFLIELLLNNENDGEIYMGAYSMIINLCPPFDENEITKSLQRLKKEEKKENNNIEKNQLIHSLSDFLEGQRNIAKFYSQFNKILT